MRDTFTSTVDGAAAFERLHGRDSGPDSSDFDPADYYDEPRCDAPEGQAHGEDNHLCTCCPECGDNGNGGVIVTTGYERETNSYSGGCTRRCGFEL